MTFLGRGGRQRTRAADAVGALAILLALGGAVAVGTGLDAQDPAPQQVPAAVDAAARGGTGQPARVTAVDGSTGPAGEQQRPSGQRSGPRALPPLAARPAVEELDYSRPMSISIPRIGVTSELVDLGLDESGVMETPEPAELAGWFTPSPPPGVPGSTVIAGHVTWDQKPTVFFRLSDLRAGDRIEVRRADDLTTVFEVTRLGTFPKDGFPTEDVFDRPDRSELRLITCGGRYDPVDRRYLSNVIVWARIVDVVRT